MPSAVRLREDYSAEELRGLARRSKDVNQSRRLLSLAGVRDGMDRGAGRLRRALTATLRQYFLRPIVQNFSLEARYALIEIQISTLPKATAGSNASA